MMELYPSNWLYNAGVIGFLRVLEKYQNIGQYLSNSTVKLPRDVFVFVSSKVKELHFGEIKELKIKGKNKYHKNYWHKNWDIKYFEIFVKELSNAKENTKDCALCYNNHGLDDEKLIKMGVPEKFLKGISQFDSRILSSLGPALTEMPNSAWGFVNTMPLCRLCAYITLFLPIGLIEVQDNNYIFINAPSFKLMWYLNKYVREIYKQGKNMKHFLGISLIELSRRMFVSFGRWEKMNIEVVSISKDEISFFSLPSEIVDILTDTSIASLLNDINEMSVLNMVLDGKFKEILSFSERVLKISLKEAINESDREFINNNITSKKNRKNLKEFSTKLFKLYALINELLNNFLFKLYALINELLNNFNKEV